MAAEQFEKAAEVLIGLKEFKRAEDCAKACGEKELFGEKGNIYLKLGKIVPSEGEQRRMKEAAAEAYMNPKAERFEEAADILLDLKEFGKAKECAQKCGEKGQLFGEKGDLGQKLRLFGAKGDICLKLSGDVALSWDERQDMKREAARSYVDAERLEDAAELLLALEDFKGVEDCAQKCDNIEAFKTEAHIHLKLAARAQDSNAQKTGAEIAIQALRVANLKELAKGLDDIDLRAKAIEVQILQVAEASLLVAARKNKVAMSLNAAGANESVDEAQGWLDDARQSVAQSVQALENEFTTEQTMCRDLKKQFEEDAAKRTALSGTLQGTAKKPDPPEKYLGYVEKYIDRLTRLLSERALGALADALDSGKSLTSGLDSKVSYELSQVLERGIKRAAAQQGSKHPGAEEFWSSVKEIDKMLSSVLPADADFIHFASFSRFTQNAEIKECKKSTLNAIGCASPEDEVPDEHTSISPPTLTVAPSMSPLSKTELEAHIKAQIELSTAETYLTRAAEAFTKGKMWWEAANIWFDLKEFRKAKECAHALGEEEGLLGAKGDIYLKLIDGFELSEDEIQSMKHEVAEAYIAAERFEDAANLLLDLKEFKMAKECAKKCDERGLFGAKVNIYLRLIEECELSKYETQSMRLEIAEFYAKEGMWWEAANIWVDLKEFGKAKECTQKLWAEELFLANGDPYLRLIGERSPSEDEMQSMGHALAEFYVKKEMWWEAANAWFDLKEFKKAEECAQELGVSRLFGTKGEICLKLSKELSLSEDERLRMTNEAIDAYLRDGQIEAAEDILVGLQQSLFEKYINEYESKQLFDSAMLHRMRERAEKYAKECQEKGLLETAADVYYRLGPEYKEEYRAAKKLGKWLRTCPDSKALPAREPFKPDWRKFSQEVSCKTKGFFTKTDSSIHSLAREYRYHFSPERRQGKETLKNMHRLLNPEPQGMPLKERFWHEVHRSVWQRRHLSAPNYWIRKEACEKMDRSLNPDREVVTAKEHSIQFALFVYDYGLETPLKWLYAHTGLEKLLEWVYVRTGLEERFEPLKQRIEERLAPIRQRTEELLEPHRQRTEELLESLKQRIEERLGPLRQRILSLASRNNADILDSAAPEEVSQI